MSVATESPLVHPVTVEASYVIDSGRLRFETGLVEPQFAPGQQQRRRQPTRGLRPGKNGRGE